MYIDVCTLCPCVSWPPLSTIITLLLRWASYCVCTSNVRCDSFLYCLVLLMRVHSELRELLSPLLFVDGSLYTNNVVLLLYHVLRECPSECVKQWIICTHFLTMRLQERIRGVICAGNFNCVYVFEFGILNQIIWSVARWNIVKRFEKLLEFSLWEPCTVIADFESTCVGRVCQESEVPLSMSCLWVDVVYLIFDLLLPRCCAQFVSCFDDE